MTIIVCPLSKVIELVATRKPERVVSLLDPEFTFPELGESYGGHHLCLHLHDIHAPSGNQIAPSARHIDDLLAFLSKWDRRAPLLVHCRAGIGRSPATAYIAACLHHPRVDERRIMDALRRASPHVRPNETLVALADTALDRGGRMIEAVKATCRNLPRVQVPENSPFELPAAF